GLVERQRDDGLAGRERREEPLLLIVAPAAEERHGAEDGGGEDGLGRELSAERLEDLREIEEAEAHAAEVLGNGEGREAELGHLGEELAREAGGMIGPPQLADARDLRLPLDELARRLGEHELLLVRNQSERRTFRHLTSPRGGRAPAWR